MTSQPTHSTAERLRELVALRDAIEETSVAFRRELKRGPRDEPACGVCAAAKGVESYSNPLAVMDYHDVGVDRFADLLGEDDLEKVAEMVTDAAEPLIRALAGALAAERSLTIYLLAGWKPPTGLRPEFIGGSR